MKGVHLQEGNVQNFTDILLASVNVTCSKMIYDIIHRLAKVTVTSNRSHLIESVALKEKNKMFSH